MQEAVHKSDVFLSDLAADQHGGSLLPAAPSRGKFSDIMIYYLVESVGATALIHYPIRFLMEEAGADVPSVSSGAHTERERKVCAEDFVPSSKDCI